MTLTNEEIVELLDLYEKETKAIISNILQLCWYMRGGLTLSEAYQLSFSEREIINTIIEEHLKITKETKLPFF